MAKKTNYRVPLHKDWHEPIPQKELAAFDINSIIDYIQKYDAEEGTKWIKEYDTPVFDKKTGKSKYPTFLQIKQAFINRYFEPNNTVKSKNIHDLIANL